MDAQQKPQKPIWYFQALPPGRGMSRSLSLPAYRYIRGCLIVFVVASRVCVQDLSSDANMSNRLCVCLCICVALCAHVPGPVCECSCHGSV